MYSLNWTSENKTQMCSNLYLQKMVSSVWPWTMWWIIDHCPQSWQDWHHHSIVQDIVTINWAGNLSFIFRIHRIRSPFLSLPYELPSFYKYLQPVTSFWALIRFDQWEAPRGKASRVNRNAYQSFLCLKLGHRNVCILWYFVFKLTFSS